VVALLVCAGFWWGQAAVVRAQAEPTATPGYFYAVQPGDSWDTVAAGTGVAVADLQAANPDAVRDNEWLLVGEQLLIPTSLNSAPKTHTVGAGESWNSIAAKYGVSADLLRAANPNSVRTGNVLYRGETLIIPPAGAALPEATAAAPATTAEATPGAEATSTPAATVTATAEVTDTVAITVPAPITDSATTTATVEPVEVITPTASVTVTPAITTSTAVTAQVELTATGTATTTDAGLGAAAGSATLPACPERFADYVTVMTELINAAPADDAADDALVGPDAVVAFLTACEALTENGVVIEDLTGDGADDLVVAYQNPNADQIFVEGDLVIFNSGNSGFTLGYRARAAGEVRLLAVEDLNLDELPDVIWVDTTCGASTCFDTVNVRSWDGSAWADWTDGTITMAYAEIALSDENEDGQGNEIVLEGGIYGSVGAGPQRKRNEVWASLAGDPYALFSKSYSPSECLYHTVLDANRAFLDAPLSGFEAATALYTSATTDTSLIKCWVRNDELEELRSFSQFRLALIAGYTGDAEGAAAAIATLNASFPDSVYAGVGQTWLDVFEADGDVVAACNAVTAYAEQNPEAWEMLADYGYTNPSFEAIDVCPVLDIEQATPAASSSEGGGGTAPSLTPSDNTAGADAPAVLSPCPTDLLAYAAVLPEVLAATGPDAEAITAWLQSCNAAGAELPVAVQDLNDDGLLDVIALPTVTTDLGLGPDGAQGALFVFLGEAAGGFTLAAAPESYGAPTLLTVDDVNRDGLMDLAWTVTACATACALEVQVLTWTGSEFVPMIQPGAVIAEGTARFTPVLPDDPGQGMALVLSGGVSGNAGGGLAVGRSESWQSIDGAPYARVGWAYVTDAPASNCLGLRLVEADVAMQAAPLIGFARAMELYGALLTGPTEACSLFDMDATQEIALLQGLALFRLVQAQAYGGDLPGAIQSLTGWLEAQMDNPYSAVAVDWLAAFERDGDGQAACALVREAFDTTPALWQVTDQFGFDHPALGADQICYVP
jgi:LysM repeat protein